MKIEKTKLTLIITGLSTGGAEIMLYNLLRNIDRNSFEPSVISLIDKGEIGTLIEALDIPVYALGMKPSSPNPFMLIKLVMLLRNIKPNIVHTWMYHADLIGGIASRLAGIKVVIWGLHHSNLSKIGNKRTTLIVAWICALLSNWLPVKILSCSYRSKEVHITAGYNENKIHVIANGFDLVSFTSNIDYYLALRAELSLAFDTPIVGVVGRFSPQKNHLGFIDAAAKVFEKMPHVHFVLVGINLDSSNDLLKDAIKAHPGLSNHIHLLGRRGDIPKIMPAFDVLALPSSFGEAFPLVLGEAMSCSVPCVVTNVGDSAEIVGASGYVVDVDDMGALARQLLSFLSLSLAERREIGDNARQRIESNYEIKYIADLYQSFYDDVIALSHHK